MWRSVPRGRRRPRSRSQRGRWPRRRGPTARRRRWESSRRPLGLRSISSVVSTPEPSLPAGETTRATSSNPPSVPVPAPHRGVKSTIASLGRGTFTPAIPVVRASCVAPARSRNPDATRWWIVTSVGAMDIEVIAARSSAARTNCFRPSDGRTDRFAVADHAADRHAVGEVVAVDREQAPDAHAHPARPLGPRRRPGDEPVRQYDLQPVG